MNDRFLTNIFKLAISFILYYTGLLEIMIRLAVRRGLLIFNYHGFNSFTNDYWRFGSLFESNYQKNFIKHVQYLSRHFQKLADLEKVEAYGTQCSYLLTFDDGYKDNFEIALPVLKKYSVPSAFFPATSVVGSREMLWFDAVRLEYEAQQPRGFFAAARIKSECKRTLRSAKKDPDGVWSHQELCISPRGSSRIMMNWEEVRLAAEAGVVIGAHTHSHPVLSHLKPDDQFDEIRTSVDIIKKETGNTPKLFSYPEGSPETFNAETIAALNTLGIRSALTTIRGINRTSDSPYFLKRIGLNPSDPVPVIALKIALEGLKASLFHDGILRNVRRIRLAFRQYGGWNASKRAVKTTLRKFGLHLDSHYILFRRLEGPIDLPCPPDGLIVKRLSYEDFANSPFYPESSIAKKELLKRRFSNPECRAFGASLGGELVYMAWISTDYLRIESIGFEKKLNWGEGVLLDALTLPKARGLGIHNYMNMVRLSKLEEMGIRKAYVAVLAENRPALKTQLKSGFLDGERLLWIAAGKARRLIKKPVSFTIPERKGRR